MSVRAFYYLKLARNCKVNPSYRCKSKCTLSTAAQHHVSFYINTIQSYINTYKNHSHVVRRNFGTKIPNKLFKCTTETPVLKNPLQLKGQSKLKERYVYQCKLYTQTSADKHKNRTFDVIS